MGTQALTHQMIARESAKMLVEKNNVVTSINTTRSKEFGEEINGYKKGDTVKIMVPRCRFLFLALISPETDSLMRL